MNCRLILNGRLFLTGSMKIRPNLFANMCSDVKAASSLDSESVLSRPLPLMTSRELYRVPKHQQAKQAWLETLSIINDKKLGIVDLHPDIFATFPRIDVLWWNTHWQSRYKKVNYEFVRNRAELPGGGRKPWPQKGTGRARHGSIRSPLWIGGGKTFGPRGPRGYFFMLGKKMRVLGLRTALSCKFAQDNLHIVNDLCLPTDEPGYLEELIESRGWGLSVLFVNE
ncbi:DgyrCDS8425 [Dimorphilus gyrociliatus]|nr:DgyrCDS8425 [Dimorphilus gyrociliatus]